MPPLSFLRPRVCLGAHVGTARTRRGHSEEHGAWLCCQAMLVISLTPPLPISRTESRLPLPAPRVENYPRPWPRPRGTSPVLHPAVGLADWPGRSSCPGTMGTHCCQGGSLKGLLVRAVCSLAVSPRPRVPSVLVLLRFQENARRTRGPSGHREDTSDGRGSQDGRWSTGHCHPEPSEPGRASRSQAPATAPS